MGELLSIQTATPIQAVPPTQQTPPVAMPEPIAESEQQEVASSTVENLGQAEEQAAESETPAAVACKLYLSRENTAC